MESDKEIALGIINLLEEYYRRTIVLESVCQSLDVHGWRFLYRNLVDLPKHHESTRELFEPFRQLVLDAPDLSTVVRHILSEVPRIDPSGLDYQN
jgi:hypothetical protein